MSWGGASRCGVTVQVPGGIFGAGSWCRSRGVGVPGMGSRGASRCGSRGGVPVRVLGVFPMWGPDAVLVRVPGEVPGSVAGWGGPSAGPGGIPDEESR